MISRKRVSYQMRLDLKPYKNGPKCLLKALTRLATLMNYRLKKLTSRKITTHWAARNLYLCFMMRGACRNGRVSKPVCRTKVPIITDKSEHGIISFWHEPAKKAVELKVLEACNKVDQKLVKASQLVKLIASGFAEVHIPRWKSFEPTERSHLKTLEKLKKPFDPYLPLTEYQLKVINGEKVIKDHPKKATVKPTMRQTKIEEYFRPRRELLANKENV